VKKIFFSFLLAANSSQAQFPSLSEHISDVDTSVIFRYKNCFLNHACLDNRGKRKTEVPPWVITGEKRSYFFVDGQQTYIWSTTQSLTGNVLINLKKTAMGPYTATLPYRNSPDYDAGVNIDNWKRNYHAIYCAHYLNHNTRGPMTLGFCHGENKNEVVGDCNNGIHFQNTIQSNALIDCNAPDTYSGGVPYHEGWDAYNGILSAAWMQNNGGQAFFNDLGPVAWPSTGYVTEDGIKCTSGLRHPSSILVNDYLYIFFVDSGVFGSNIPQEEGRQEGIKVVRVHKDQALDPFGYRIYYKDPSGNISWEPSLPAGLTKENMLNYVGVKGPRSSDILNDTSLNYQMIRFSAAKVKNTNYFIGVEQYIDLPDSNKVKVALRFSADLLNWSDRQLVIYSAATWEDSSLNYPIFTNQEGSSNTEIDLSDFYVLGSAHTPSDHIQKKRIHR